MTNSSGVLKPSALLIAAVGFCACSTSAPRSSIGQEQDRTADRAELLELNDKLAQSQIVDRDPAFF